MEEGIKHDEGKLRFDLLPIFPIQKIVEVLGFGAKKYGDRNWEDGMNWSRVYAACLRHLTAFWSGQNNDTETKLSHLAHAGCCLLFLLEYTRTMNHLDDRPSLNAIKNVFNNITKQGHSVTKLTK